MNEPSPPRRRGRAFDWSTAAIAALAFTAAAIIYWRDGREHFLAVLGGDISLLGDMLPKVLAAFGFILPGGPITIYPVAGAFIAMGADAGAIVAFITCWALVGYTRALVWELPFFGTHFVIWRIVEALPLPIIAGLLARIVLRAGLARRDGA